MQIPGMDHSSQQSFACRKSVKPELFELREGSTTDEPLGWNIYDLIVAGADIFAISPRSLNEDNAKGKFQESPICTPTTLAMYENIEHIWKWALRKAGYDPLEVYAEDECRRREYLRYNGGTTSSVEWDDSAEIEKISQFRLRKQWACEDQ